MDVIVSNSVKTSLESYKKSLYDYPISKTRAINKYVKMIESLRNLGKSIYTPPICRYKDLGQVFDSAGNPLNKNLKQVSYSDTSGFQWIFSCHYDESNDTITIVKMLASKQIKEEYHSQVQLVLEFLERMRRIE